MKMKRKQKVMIVKGRVVDPRERINLVAALYQATTPLSMVLTEIQETVIELGAITAVIDGEPEECDKELSRLYWQNSTQPDSLAGEVVLTYASILVITGKQEKIN